jgi:hypothetical protein
LNGFTPCLAVTAQNNRTHVARPRSVRANGFAHGFNEFVARVIDIDAVNLRGIEQALNVLVGAEDRGFALRRVAADALEYRGAVVDHVRHHVNRGVIPGNELAVVPDKFGLLDSHADSFSGGVFQQKQRG